MGNLHFQILLVDCKTQTLVMKQNEQEIFQGLSSRVVKDNLASSKANLSALANFLPAYFPLEPRFIA